MLCEYWEHTECTQRCSGLCLRCFLRSLYPDIFFAIKVTIGNHSNCCESNQTAAAVLYEGASYKVFRSTFQAYRPNFIPKDLEEFSSSVDDA